jgi:hypothetical protein
MDRTDRALQLLAYHTALAHGTDVAKPRNLAKKRDGRVNGHFYFLNSTTPLTHILCGFAAMPACRPRGICALAGVIFGFLFARESQYARFKFLILPAQCELKCWADKTLAQPTSWRN